MNFEIEINVILTIHKPFIFVFNNFVTAFDKNKIINIIFNIFVFVIIKNKVINVVFNIFISVIISKKDLKFKIIAIFCRVDMRKINVDYIARIEIELKKGEVIFVN